MKAVDEYFEQQTARYYGPIQSLPDYYVCRCRNPKQEMFIDSGIVPDLCAICEASE